MREFDRDGKRRLLNSLSLEPKPKRLRRKNLLALDPKRVRDPVKSVAAYALWCDAYSRALCDPSLTADQLRQDVSGADYFGNLSSEYTRIMAEASLEQARDEGTGPQAEKAFELLEKAGFLD